MNMKQEKKSPNLLAICTLYFMSIYLLEDDATTNIIMLTIIGTS